MKTLKVNNHKDDVSNQAMIIQIELLRMMNTNSFDETIDFAKEADQFLLKYKDEVPDTKQFTFQYNIMILYDRYIQSVLITVSEVKRLKSHSVKVSTRV